MYLTLVLVFISGLCKGVTDTLVTPKERDKYTGWFSAGRNYVWAEQFPNPLRMLAFMVVDAWHLLDLVRILALCVAVTISPGLPWWAPLPLFLLHQTGYNGVAYLMRGRL